MTIAAASRLLAEVAAERGLPVVRHTPELVACQLAGRSVLFWGLAGPRAGKAAQVLCGNPGWLRGQLARAGVPVVTTRLADVADPGYVERLAASLDLPLTLRLVTPAGEASALPVGHTVASMAEFPAAWREACVGAGPRDQVILEQRPAGPVVEVAVVAGSVVAGSTVVDDWADASEVACRAVAALPDAGYGSVRLILTADGPVVEAVEPTMSGWAAVPAGRQVAGAILTAEQT